MIICCNAFLRVGLDLQSPIYEEKRDLNLLNLPFFLLLFVKLQHDLLYTLICFFWVPWNHSTRGPGKKCQDGYPSGSWKNPGSPGDFTWHRWKFELLETLRGVGDSPGILSKTWIHGPCIFKVLNRCIFCEMFCWYWYYVIIIVVVSIIIIIVYHIGHIVFIWNLFRYMSVFVRYWWVQIWVVFCRDWECIGLDSSAWTGGCCYIDSCLPSGNMSHCARPWNSMSA